VQSESNGQWYKFDADGAYRYTMMGSGRFISGAIMDHGSYEVRGNRLLLHRKTQSWFPLPRDAARRPSYKDRPSPEDSAVEIEFTAPSEMRVRQRDTTDTFRKRR
jgi:hypothetical protein